MVYWELRYRIEIVSVIYGLSGSYSMTKDTIRGIIGLCPDLTYSGFAVGGGPKRSLRQRAAEIRGERQRMLTSAACDEFRRACHWLDEQPRTQHINRKSGNSYILKEEVELGGGHVSSGMFIAAAIACGYDVEQAGFNSRHAWLNIGQIRLTNPNLHLTSSRRDPTAVIAYSPRPPRFSIPGTR